MTLRGSAILAVLILSGCGAAGASGQAGGATVAPMSPSLSLPPARPQCSTASAAAITAIDASIKAKNRGNSLPEAISWADPDVNAWWIVGAIKGPASSGEVALGAWSTTSDPTVESFTGPVYAVDGGARTWSDAQTNTVVRYDPTMVPALGCWSDKNR